MFGPVYDLDLVEKDLGPGEVMPPDNVSIQL